MACLLLAAVRPGAAQTPAWTPPLGIPMPPFGISETAPPAPSPWIAPTAGFYYVDETAAGSTDASNPYGTPARPRRTIPIRLTAGSVVEVHGRYSHGHTSPYSILSVGTPDAPVFIRGVSPTERPVITGCWETWGAYFVIENVEFAECGNLVLFGLTHHAALRHSDVHGTPSTGGLKVVSWDGDPVTDVVLWDNTIHDNGDVHAAYDQDVHGILVGGGVSYLWVVDNELYRNSGDGIQISAGSAAWQATTHHIYVGRNVAHDNKQSGFWTKQAVDVIFSQNVSYRHRPGNSSLGVCMGGQYAPEMVWFIANAMWDCDFGIQVASDNGLGYGRYLFFIGNIIFRIHDSNGDFQPGSAWQNCGISLPGGTYRYIAENDLSDVDSGVCTQDYQGRLYLFDNVIQSVRPDGHHLMFDHQQLADSTMAGGNLFAPDFRFAIGGDNTVYSTPEQPVTGQNNLVTDVGWVAPAAGDFRLTASSPARGHGVMNTLGIWEYFQARYGVGIALDFYGASHTTPPAAGAVE